MARKPSTSKASGSELTVAVAEKVFGWRNVHEHQGELIGKKQDKLGRWRLARIPDYASDPKQAYAIEERMKQTGRFDLYAKELSRLTKAKGLPAGMGCTRAAQLGCTQRH